MKTVYIPKGETVHYGQGFVEFTFFKTVIDMS